MSVSISQMNVEMNLRINAKLANAVPCCAVLSRSVTSDSPTPWTVARQAPLPVGFSRQGYWSVLPCPPLGDLRNPGIKHTFPMSPKLAGRFFTTNTTWEVHPYVITATAKSLQSCPTLCDPIDGSPPGSSVPGILQAKY